MSQCVYMVAYVPPACSEYRYGDIIYLPCDDECADIIIADGPCKGTWLWPCECGCI
jgi:hypothetical protein